MLERARAFSPAGISSFFEICDRNSNGNLITNLELVGARGGGFVIGKGVLTEVSVCEAEKSSVRVYINGEYAANAQTTKAVTRMLLEKAEKSYEVVVRHKIAVPIGAGFGSSAAGALSAVLALSKALGIDHTILQAGKLAHIAEIECRTGLGTVGPVTFGGCVVTVEPGAPGIAVIDRIPTVPEHRIVAGFCRPISTRKVLESAGMKEKVNRVGRETVERIVADPSLENFMNASRDFSKATGFSTPRAEKLCNAAVEAGAIGAAQNMIGEAVHALVWEDKVVAVVEAFKKVIPLERILTARIDLEGARLL